MAAAAKHTCWDDPKWDGCITADCAGCDEAKANPCAWCGYGHIFTTHNPEAHVDDTEGHADPVLLAICERDGIDCYDAFDRYFDTDAPYVEQPKENV